jgi:hypothetical protein
VNRDAGFQGNTAHFTADTKEVGPRLVKRGHEVIVYCRRSLFRERPKMHRECG